MSPTKTVDHKCPARRKENALKDFPKVHNLTDFSLDKVILYHSLHLHYRGLSKSGFKKYFKIPYSGKLLL